MKHISEIKLLVMDVDGTLTNGLITYDERGGELKSFHVADGLGIVMAVSVGLHCAVITGRSSEAVTRRMTELGVTDILQGISDKAAAVKELMAKYEVTSEQTAFIADDINDLPAFAQVGTKIAVSDAVTIIRHAADIILTRPGGHGAVREAIEEILRSQGRLDDGMEIYLARRAKPESGQ
jgi:3-deoxy-D-manno-octulosonate 8-phosphate phosphatase (KDO 8-P phosphatase)